MMTLTALTYSQSAYSQSALEPSRREEAAAGQAMVEFVFMLIVLFAMVVGMIHISHLLNYDYWAQQEARFLAFEQTWVPASYYEESGESPNDIVANGRRLRRPRSVSRLDVEKTVEDKGSLTSLIASLFSPKVDSNPGVLLAANHQLPRDSIWHTSTREWIASVKESTSLVKTAYAGLMGGSEVSTGSTFEFEHVDGPRVRGGISSDFKPDSLERGIRHVLELVDFGESFCEGMRDVFGKHGFQPGVQAFSKPECGREINTDFSLHIAVNTDIKEIFRDYEYQVEGGVDHFEAIDRVVRMEVANQFYSFFDQTVALARVGAVSYIMGVRLERSLTNSISDVVRMITDARYVGSSIAITAISGAQLAQILNVNVNSRSSRAEKALQDVVFGILHADVTEAAYLLNPTYLPVPPTFLGGMSALQNAVMENVLRGGENAIGDFLGDSAADESDLIETLIEDSNKLATVTYEARKGMIPAAARRFKNDTRLTSRFFLVTQPWHITRKVSPLGEFRDIGTESDGIGEDTEEAILRRRVAGLWLFPSAPTAFFTAPFEFFDSGGLGGLLDVVSGFDSVIATLKSLLIDNPLIRLTDVLSDIPLIGNLVPTIPKFPAVRPAAYPGSVELRDQDHSPDDRLSGSVRNFSDYVDEQSYNPPAQPEFDNDTFE